MNRIEQNFICPVCLTCTLQMKKIYTKKQLQGTKINYSRKQANIKYYKANKLFSISYTYLISKLEHIKFLTELDSERMFIK